MKGSELEKSCSYLEEGTIHARIEDGTRKKRKRITRGDDHLFPNSELQVDDSGSITVEGAPVIAFPLPGESTSDGQVTVPSVRMEQRITGRKVGGIAVG